MEHSELKDHLLTHIYLSKVLTPTLHSEDFSLQGNTSITAILCASHTTHTVCMGKAWGRHCSVASASPHPQPCRARSQPLPHRHFPPSLRRYTGRTPLPPHHPSSTGLTSQIPETQQLQRCRYLFLSNNSVIFSIGPQLTTLHRISV